MYAELGLFGLGDLPAGAARIEGTSGINRWRPRFPTLPDADVLLSKGATHYTTSVISGTQQSFTFYDSDGDIIVGPITVNHAGTGPVTPEETTGKGVPAHQEGDGLLPSATATSTGGGAPTWLPYALLGGGVLVAGGIVYMAVRKPKPVTANRRRRRRRRRTSR